MKKGNKKIVETLFGNVGGKLKLLALIVFYVMLIGGVGSGIILMIADDDLVTFGLIALAAGLLLSWISALPLYAFGQLVENSDKIKNAVTNGAEGESTVASNASETVKIEESPEKAGLAEKEKKAAQLKEWLNADLITEEEYKEKMAKL